MTEIEPDKVLVDLRVLLCSMSGNLGFFFGLASMLCNFVDSIKPCDSKPGPNGIY